MPGAADRRRAERLLSWWRACGRPTAIRSCRCSTAWRPVRRAGSAGLRLARLAPDRQHALCRQRRAVACRIAWRAAPGARLHPESGAAVRRDDRDQRHQRATSTATRRLRARSRVEGRCSTICVARGVDHLIVGGLATDYCVRASVLDALRQGLGGDGCRRRRPRRRSRRGRRQPRPRRDARGRRGGRPGARDPPGTCDA